MHQATHGAAHAYLKSSGVGWTAARVSGDAPFPRCGATATVDPSTGHVYLAGGLGEDNSFLSDLWRLELGASEGEWSWHKCVASGAKKRAWHTTAMVGGKLLVFGGQCGLEDVEGCGKSTNAPEPEDASDDEVDTVALQG